MEGSPLSIRGDSEHVAFIGRVRGGQDGVSRRRFTITALVAAGAFLVWAAVVLTVAPQRLLTYAAFFTPLYVALAATGAGVSYWAYGGTPEPARWRASLRRGGLFAAVIVLNLALAAARAWTPGIGLIVIMLVVVPAFVIAARAKSRQL